MAIKGKYNVIELARSHNAPYWKIYESEHKRGNGNFVAIAEYENPALSIENSMDKLGRDLDRLTPGRYVFVAFKNNTQQKGMVDTFIEIEGGNSVSAISGTGTTPQFFIAGFGTVTPDNFEEAIETKMKAVREEERKLEEQARLKAENAELKRQLAENEAGFNKGVMTIGTIAYGMMSQTPQGKEFIGLAKQAMFATNKIIPGAIETTAPESTGEDSAISGTSDDERLVNAVETLGRDNPAWLSQLEKLAALKQKDPATFEMAVGSLDSL